MLNLHYLRFFLSHIFCIFKTGVITLQQFKDGRKKKLEPQTKYSNDQTNVQAYMSTLYRYFSHLGVCLGK